MIIFVGLKMQVGHIQIILLDHVSLKIRNTYINPRLTKGGCCNPPYGFSPVALKR